MRRLFSILLGVMVLLSLPIMLSARQDSAPLTLLDTQPDESDELAVDGPILLNFDHTLDCDTANASFAIEPVTSGRLDCQGNSLSFMPDQPFERGARITVRLSTALQSEAGVSLSQPVELFFQTEGFLRVAEVFPAEGSEEVDNDTSLTVIFNRPVVPVATSMDTSDLPQPLQLEPQVAGSGEWINTSIYEFTPDAPLPGGITYIASVSDVTALDGSELAAPFEWTFTTRPPQIIDVVPQDDTDGVRIDEPIQVRFNQPMEQASVESSFVLFPLESPESVVTGEFEWSDDDAGFRFTPDEELALGQTYAGAVGPGARAAGYGAALDSSFEFTFSTVPFPSILSTSPSDNATDVSPYSGFTIRFASPMNIDTLEDRVIIEPEPEDFNTYYSDYDNSYSISFTAEPSADYTVTLEAGMEDIYGNVIEAPKVIEYATSPIEPMINSITPGMVGFYNAYRQPTALYVTHINVSEINIDLYRVPEDVFISQASTPDPWRLVDEYTPQPDELLRSWTIPNVAPENALRYELLDLGAAAAGAPVNCPNAMESTLKVGDVAIVVSDPDPLRARSEPATGEILELLYEGYQMPITGGPECIDGAVWWQVELREGDTAWVAEGLDDERFIDVSVPAQATSIAVQNEDGTTLAPGIYYLELSSPETAERNQRPLRHMLVVSTTVVTMKSATDSVALWATDVETGDVLSDVPVEVYSPYDEIVASGTTDSDGLFTADVPPVESLWMPRLAIVSDGEHFGVGYSDWSNGIEPYQFGYEYSFEPETLLAYMYTDRPIYRTGQPVYYRGVIRSKDDMSYTPPGDFDVSVIIRDSEGETVETTSLPVTSYGTFSGEFTLAEDAALGSYTIEIEVPDEVLGPAERFRGGWLNFSVGEFRLPEYQIAFTPAADEVVDGDDVVVDVNAQYFFGGAVGDAAVTYGVITEPYYFDYQGDGNYSFSDVDVDAGPAAFRQGAPEQIATGEGTTDENGNYQITFPASLADSNQSQRLTIEASIRDESGQTVSSRTNVIVHKAFVYPGVRAQQYISTEGEETAFDILTVDWDSQPVTEQTVDVQIVERRWFSVQEQDERGRTTWTWDVEEIPVADGTVTTDENGEATFAFTPEEGGVYKAIVTTRDEAGHEARSATTIWVSGSEYVSWRQQNSNRIDLVTDADEYKVGDTAEVLITSPFQGEVEALVTVERGSVLSMERITMDTNSYVYELPITDDFAPNVFVSVMLVKGVDENNPVASFRMGVARINVDIAQKELNLDIEADREQAQPQDTVTYTIRATDYAGNPVDAEIGVGVTDLASLSVAEANSIDILDAFYSSQLLNVRTSTGLAINTDQLTQETLDTIKGGGGGFLQQGLMEIRGEFIDTPYWNPTVTTGEDGEATIEVRLPDNLTTWRLDARGVTASPDGNMLVGQETFDLISTRPLIVRPATPRFFVVDDRVFLGAVVNNNTEDEQETTVTLRADGLTFVSEPSQTVTIPAGGRTRVEWEVIVEDVSAVQAVFVADAGEVSDASVSAVSLDDEGTLPVYRYSVPETVGTSGVLRGADERTEAIVLPDNIDTSRGELVVQVDQSLAAPMIDGLERLRNYPYQSTEQTISRFLPNIMTYRALSELGVPADDMRNSLDASVSLALQKLYAEQKSDGGWGWYVSDRSSPLITAYALIGLTEARAQGYSVSDAVLDNAQSFVQRSLRPMAETTERWRKNQQAFLLYALARSGAPDVARTSNLYEYRDTLAFYAQAYLAETLYIINPEDTSRVDTLISNIIGQAELTASGVRWRETDRDVINWNTDTRSTAIILHALTEVQAETDLLPGVVRYLITQRSADSWETTQETAWSVMALTNWMLISGELSPDYDYTVDLNGETLLEGQASPSTVRDSNTLSVAVADLLRDEANMLTFARGEGDGALYYTAYLNASLPVADVEPLDEGISISRRYIDPATGEPVTEGQVGDLLTVRLTVIVPYDRHYVVITDPLPAGAEGVDPQLATSQQIGTRPELESSDPLAYGWGWWWFSRIEFRDEQVNLYSTYLPAGTYEYVYSIRLGTAGEYNVIPPTGQELYFPDVYGRGAGSTFTVEPADE